MDKLNVNYSGHQINAEPISVPENSPYKARTVHNRILKEEPSTIEIWQYSDKSGSWLTEEPYTGTVSSTGKFQVDYDGAEDGDMKFRNTILFHAAQANTEWFIWYKSVGDIYDADDFNAKVNKTTGTENNFAALDNAGGIKDSGKKAGDFEPKIDPKGTAFNKNFGNTAGTVCEGNDSRLSDARPPTAHKDSHITGGDDIIPNAVSGGNSGLMTGADKQNLDDAVAKKHEHSNKSQLDTYSATTADLTFYVNPSTGDDNNNGSSGSPFKTIAKAISLIPRIVNHNVTINLADGNYSEGITLTGYMGGGEIYILGNIDHPENVVISGQVYILNNAVQVVVMYFECTYVNNAAINVALNPAFVVIDSYTCVAPSSYEGVKIEDGSTVLVSDSTISNRSIGIYSKLSVVHSYHNNGSSNQYGLCAENGIIYKLDNQPSGHLSNERTISGGQILSSRLAERDEDAVENNLAKFDANGNPVDSGVKPVDLALKDPDAVAGNLAKFDSDGNPVDSGIAISDVSKNSNGLSLIQNGSFEIVDSNSVPWCWEKIGIYATLASETATYGNDGQGGNKSLKVTSGGTGNEGAKYTFRHLKPSTTYSIRIWMRAVAGDTAKAWTTGGSSNFSVTTTSTAPEYKTGTFTTDSTPTNVILCVGADLPTDIGYFDCVTVIEGPTPPDKYLPSPQPTVFEFQDFYPAASNFPGLETLVGTNILKKYVYALDDTTEEPLGFNFSIPPNFDPSGFIMLECVGWAKTAAASKNIEYTYYYSPKKYGEDWDTAYSNIVSGDLALYSTQDYRDNLRFQLSINTMGVEAYDVVEGKISRTAPSMNNLSGNYYFEKLRIWIPRV
jgi:hypothetical protein